MSMRILSFVNTLAGSCAISYSVLGKKAIGASTSITAGLRRICQ
jgi:hypothetical protein